MLPSGSTVSLIKSRIAARVPGSQLNLEATLLSGQSFCWLNIPPHAWCGWIAGQPCWVETESGTHLFYSPTLSGREIEEYFQLRVSLPEILQSFPSDPWLAQSLAFAPGLRILRQDPWETLASFICSSVKQIVQIQAINQTLRSTLGTQVYPGWHAFPSAQQVALAGETVLRGCKLGFRARHLHGTARTLMESGLGLRDWDLLPTTELRSQLMTLPGVGEKIADCVLLFGFGRYEVFPIDVWVERVLAELYFARARNRKRERLRAFAWKYFGPYRGYAQQYLFHWIRTGRGQRPSSPTRRPARGPGTRRSKVPK